MAERGERVELLRRQMTRRMMNASLASGWAAWHELWNARAYALARLRHVANRLHKPSLSAAFEGWVAEWQACVAEAEAFRHKAREEQLAIQLAEVEATLRETIATYEAKLALAAQDKRAAMARQLDEVSGSAEARAAAEAARAKEERVELLRRQMTRRMMNASLASGWAAWHELWNARTYAHEQLRRVAGRLRTPQLFGAFHSWARVWEAARREAIQRERDARRSELEVARAEHAAELASVRDMFEAKLAAEVAARQAALEKQAIQLTGSDEELAALRAAQEREGRIDLLRRQIGRRLYHRDLANGWASWHELWSAKRYAIDRLREVGARLRTPEVAFAFRSWRGAWEAAVRRAEREAAARQKATIGAKLRQAHFELDQQLLTSTAQAHELEALQHKMRSVEALLAERDAQLQAVESLMSESEEMRELYDETRAQARSLRATKDDAEMEAARKRRENQELLERLLREQRERFEVELRERDERASQQREEEKTALADARQQLQASEQALAKARVALEQTQADATAELSRARDEAARKTTALEVELETLRSQGADMRSQLTELREEASHLRAEAAEAAKPRPVKPPAQHAKVKESERRKGFSPLGRDFDLDESEGAPPISEQLAGALRKSAGKVLDLFRDWDADGDGEVSRKEFHKAMPALGLEVPKAAIDELFSQWDRSGDGSIGYKELTKILRARPSAAQPVKGAGTAALAALKLAAKTSNARAGQ